MHTLKKKTHQDYKDLGELITAQRTIGSHEQHVYVTGE